MEDLGGFVIAQIVKAVREAQARGEAPPSRTPEDLRAQVAAEIARRKQQAQKPGQRAGQQPPRQGQTPAPGAGRRQPAFGAPAKPSPAAPRVPQSPQLRPAQRPQPPGSGPFTVRPPVAAPSSALPPTAVAPGALLAGVEAVEAQLPEAATGADALGPAAPPTIDLRAVFGQRDALIGALVLSEALAPPLSVRPHGAHRELP